METPAERAAIVVELAQPRKRTGLRPRWRRESRIVGPGIRCQVAGATGAERCSIRDAPAGNPPRGISWLPRRRQVPGCHLAVDQLRCPAARASADQPHQGHLRRVRLQAEHRLAEEDAAERDSVEAADEFAIRARSRRSGHGPSWCRSQVGRAHLRRDPGAGGCARAGAGVDHRCEVPGRPRPGSDRCAASGGGCARQCSSPGSSTARGSGDHHRIGCPVLVPGKDAAAVGREQPLRRQVAADGEQAVRLPWPAPAGSGK